jgi:hypothetical protein
VNASRQYSMLSEMWTEPRTQKSPDQTDDHNTARDQIVVVVCKTAVDIGARFAVAA